MTAYHFLQNCATSQEVAEHLSQCEETFVTSLAAKIAIPDYAKKLPIMLGVLKLGLTTNWLVLWLLILMTIRNRDLLLTCQFYHKFRSAALVANY